MTNNDCLKLALLIGGIVLIIYVISNCNLFEEKSNTKITDIEDITESYENTNVNTEVNNNTNNEQIYRENDDESDAPTVVDSDVDGTVIDSDIDDNTLQDGLKKHKQLDPSELLPKDEDANAWSKVNPKGKGSLSYKNFIESAKHIGVNTVGQSLRNANYGIRSEPANPQQAVSIWMNSTIGADVNRKPLEIGGQ